MKARFFFVIFIFTLWSPINLLAQEIELIPAPMSSGDSKLLLESIGNSSDGYLVLLDNKGIAWKYNGYQLTRWNTVPFKNPSYLQSVFLLDTILYAFTNDALIGFGQNNPMPKVINKSSNHYFIHSDKGYGFAADSDFFLFDAFSKKRIKDDFFPIREKDYAVDDSGELFYFLNNQLIWTYPEGKVLARKSVDGISQIIVDKWNQKWLLVHQKLFQLKLDRASSETSTFTYQSNQPIQLLKSNEDFLSLYSNGSVVLWTNNRPTELYKNSRITNLLIDSKGDFWAKALSENPHSNSKQSLNLILIQKDQILEWKPDQTGQQEEVISIVVEDDVYNFIQPNAGVVQAKGALEANDWIWINHRLNPKLKNLGIIATLHSDKLYLFSENHGIFTLNQKEIGSITKNFPSYGIQEVSCEDLQCVLLDKGKRFHLFNANQKTIEPIKIQQLPPEISGKSIVYHDKKIIYRSDNQLITIHTDHADYTIEDYPFDFEKPIYSDPYLLNIDTKKQVIQQYVPKRKVAPIVPPQITEYHLTTRSKNKLDLHQIKDRILLLEEDFPVQLTIKAIDINHPNTIEFGWKSGDSWLRDFTFNSTFLINEPQNISFSAIVKQGERTIELPPKVIQIEKVEAKADYKWAIYLSLVLGGLLILSFAMFRWRNKQQKRNIERLKMEKKTLELEQKALQLQMNPHFIFNALNGVKGMIALGDQKKARLYLTKISTWMRTMLNDSRSEYISISDEISHLETYLQIEQELRGNQWNYEIQVDDRIHGSEMIPPMMIQPFLENCVVHAFKNIDYQGLIKINILPKGNKLEVIIDDNGRGLELISPSSHQSVALKVIQDRLKLLHANPNITPFQLTDKKSENPTLTGVRVHLILPIL